MLENAVFLIIYVKVIQKSNQILLILEVPNMYKRVVHVEMFRYVNVISSLCFEGLFFVTEPTTAPGGKMNL